MYMLIIHYYRLYTAHMERTDWTRD